MPVEIKYIDFTVHAPLIDSKGSVTKTIKVPVYFDTEAQTDVLMAEAHQLIEMMKIRLMLGVIYKDLQGVHDSLRELFSLHI